MSYFKKALLILLSILLVASYIPALFFLPAERIIFRAATYQEALVAQGFYEKAPAWAVQFLLERSGLAGQIEGAPALAGLNREKMEGIFRQLFPPEVLEIQGALVIQQVWNYLNFQTDELEILLDLRAFKEHLNGSGRELIIQEILRSWPACTAEQIIIIAGSALMGNFENAPLCRPPDEFMPFFENIASQITAQIIGGFPDQVYLLSAGQQNQLLGAEQARQWGSVWGTYRTARTALRIAPLAALFLSVIILLLNTRSFWKGLILLGTVLAVSGILVLVFAGGMLFSAGLAGRVIVDLLFSGVPEQISGALLGAFRFVLTRFAIWSMLAGFCAAVIGGVFLVLPRYFLPHTSG
ncbi:MAG: hypothetical protein IT308_08515 [Anaerolineaceae bacterium]|nr:hypothetical protein [Anaerolineaceae bacterium]